MMNDDALEVVLRRRLGQLAGLARTTPRRLPSTMTTPAGNAPGSRSTAWRAALVVGSAAAVVAGLVVLAQRDQPRSPADAPGPVLPVQTTTNVTVTVVPQPLQDPPGVITYATTMKRNTTWPTVARSGPPANNRGYGMALCDGSTWTKFASLQSDSEPRHTYVGTLCTITTLTDPAPGTVATCAAVTPDVPHYARCQRLDDTSTGTTALHADNPDTTVESDATPLGLQATPSDAKPIFGTDVAAASREVQFTDATASVLLTVGETKLITCFDIDFATFSSSGCLDANLLATGLAYGASRDGDGPIELVGIVPDDVATVEVAGTVIPVHDNVWHYTASPGTDLTFTVRASDETRSASLG